MEHVLSSDLRRIFKAINIYNSIARSVITELDRVAILTSINLKGRDLMLDAVHQGIDSCYHSLNNMQRSARERQDRPIVAWVYELLDAIDRLEDNMRLWYDNRRWKNIFPTTPSFMAVPQDQRVVNEQ
jgi:hypothetical protein